MIAIARNIAMYSTPVFTKIQDVVVPTTRARQDSRPDEKDLRHKTISAAENSISLREKYNQVLEIRIEVLNFMPLVRSRAI